MTRIGLLGCGNIGRIIARHNVGNEIVALFDRISERAENLGELAAEARIYTDFHNFIQDDFDILVEAASIEAVHCYAEETLRQGKDLVMMSVGALADSDFKKRLVNLASAKCRKIRIPSGAIFGLDNLKIARVSGVDTLVLRTTKHPNTLKLEVKERRLVFKGTAEQCIKLYPKNVNVAVALSLASEKTVLVELWADPKTTRNTHEIFMTGEFGTVNIKIENLPSPDNPATSYLAALSIVSLLKNLDEPLVVGT